MEWKENKVVMLPTEDITGVILHGSGLDTYHNINTNKGMVSALNAVKNIGGESQHLYITSDEKIKEGDWYYDTLSKKVLKRGDESEKWHVTLKIIASTDKSIQALKFRGTALEGFSKVLRGVKATPSQQFIEDYCKNPVDEVMVGYEIEVRGVDGCDCSTNNQTEFCTPLKHKRLKLTNNEITIKPINTCKYIKREGESCTKNNNCTYPNCEEKMYTKQEALDNVYDLLAERTGLIETSQTNLFINEQGVEYFLTTYGFRPKNL